MFAKMFDTEYGQVVVIRQSNDSNGNPEVRFYHEPVGLGLCSLAFEYEEDAWEERDEGFDKVTLEMASQAAKQLSVFS